MMLGLLAGAIAFVGVCFPIGYATFDMNSGLPLLVAVGLGGVAALLTMHFYFRIFSTDD